MILIILHALKIDLTKPSIIILSALSFVTLIIFFLYLNKLPLAYAILVITEYNNITTSGIRNFGGVDFLGVDFQSSPLIVLPIGYFAMKLHKFKGWKKLGIAVLLLVNISAMFIGGTRSNMIISVLLPLVVFVWYSRRKRVISITVFFILALFIFYNLNVVQGFFSEDDTSNSIKLVFFNDYMELFNQWDILLFGQGLGSYFNSTIRGYVSVSELTYFEMIRRFGLILSIFIFSLLLYPLSKLIFNHSRNHQSHYIFIAYFFYLIICFANPFLMGSTGMLFLALVLYKTFSKTSDLIKV